MAYFKDMTPYAYPPFASQGSENLLNIGWLEAGIPYPTGEIDADLLRRILDLCKMPVNRTRGWHRCPFCGKCPVVISFGDGNLKLGDAEIRVQGTRGRSFACPTLVYHYIEAHNYRPPQEFVEALRQLGASVAPRTTLASHP